MEVRGRHHGFPASATEYVRVCVCARARLPPAEQDLPPSCSENPERGDGCELRAVSVSVAARQVHAGIRSRRRAGGKAPPVLRRASRPRERGSRWRAGRLLRMRSALARLWRRELRSRSPGAVPSPDPRRQDGVAGRAGPAAAGGGRWSGGRAAGGAVSLRAGGASAGRTRAFFPGVSWRVIVISQCGLGPGLGCVARWFFTRQLITVIDTLGLILFYLPVRRTRLWRSEEHLGPVLCFHVGPRGQTLGLRLARNRL